MTKIFKHRVMIALICSLLALGALLLYARSVQTEAEKITVVRMATNVAKGQVITEKNLETVTVGGYNLDRSVVTDAKKAVGKYAATDLVKGAVVLKANLSDNILSAADRLGQLDGTRVAYSISIKDFSDGLSDKLTAGDIVSLYINKDKKYLLPPELTYVEVLSSTTKKGVDRQDRQDNDNLATVTLLVNQKQALLLTDYEDDAEIHLALVYRGDAKTAQQFLDKQDEVLR